MKNYIIIIFIAGILTACGSKKHADLIVQNGKVYTVDDQFSMAEAFAVVDGKIVELGSSAAILAAYDAPEIIDAKGKAVFPGFIDAHAHFLRYGQGLQNANLVGTTSWGQILTQLQAFADENKEGWIIGRGWDQNDWQQKEFPDKSKLDILFPNRPVMLSRVDGHAVIANQAALDLAKIVAGQKLTGGEVVTKNGKLTGLLIDNAVDLVTKVVPPLTSNQNKEALLDAAKNCFAVGLTTVDDCGIDFTDVNFIDSLQKAGDLKMRLYVMLSDAQKNYDFLFKNGKIKTDFLNVRSFKVYGDGALGSRGACLLSPYQDAPGNSGFLLSNAQHFKEAAKKIAEHDFQMCTHAIGDSANRTILKIYADVLKGKNDKRWRIEHAQVVNPNDFKLFGDFNIVPSVQPTHATSDMYWAKDRLGNERVKSAYAYQQLLKQNGWLPLGTDFPVEDINPIYTFYASVIRKDLQQIPAGGFQMENALSRKEALQGMTIWAAKANFEEQEKGSLEKGKFADFVILDQDLMTVQENNLPKTKVIQTYIGGKNVYKK
ncbi:amidohydrolase [Pedobacter cryophilus]|uniref:Amidohydrolase n=1 Tax=Pedobacter cryophilus TaxID=2571271 RepID=A0A4V5NXX0_9SPHI|nr:amidohydrolase [Pedobacter cryophilus]TKC01041.1 amidohydrolase [Pedobacter cryophilus]